MSGAEVPAAVLAALGAVSTPTVVNGLKRLGVDPAEIASFDRRVVAATSPGLGPRVGFALTRTVCTRRGGPAADAARAAELDRRATGLLADLPGPAFLVARNVGDVHGPVCLWGEVMARVGLAAGIVAGLTDGPVRDVAEMEALGFATFAGGVGVGGGHVDMLDVGRPVELAGVTVVTGDLLHGDRHGVVRVPRELAARLPEALEEVARAEARVFAYCDSPRFRLDGVAAVLRGSTDLPER